MTNHHQERGMVDVQREIRMQVLEWTLCAGTLVARKTRVFIIIIIIIVIIIAIIIVIIIIIIFKCFANQTDMCSNDDENDIYAYMHISIYMHICWWLVTMTMTMVLMMYDVYDVVYDDDGATVWWCYRLATTMKQCCGWNGSLSLRQCVFNLIKDCCKVLTVQ